MGALEEHVEQEICSGVGRICSTGEWRVGGARRRRIKIGTQADAPWWSQSRGGDLAVNTRGTMDGDGATAGGDPVVAD